MTNRFQIECAIHFRRPGSCALKEICLGTPPTPATPSRLPRITRLMALAIRMEHLVRTSSIKDHTTLAKLGQVSRARVSQIMNLTHLAPDIQEQLLYLQPNSAGRAPVLLADLQPIAALADWTAQRRCWRQLGGTPNRRAVAPT